MFFIRLFYSKLSNRDFARSPGQQRARLSVFTKILNINTINVLVVHKVIYCPRRYTSQSYDKGVFFFYFFPQIEIFTVIRSRPLVCIFVAADVPLKGVCAPVILVFIIVYCSFPAYPHPRLVFVLHLYNRYRFCLLQ